MSRTTLRRYCECGSSAVVTGGASQAQGVIDIFNREHHGEGHREVTPDACARARRAADDEAVDS